MRLLTCFRYRRRYSRRFVSTLDLFETEVRCRARLNMVERRIDLTT
jgi:hypothetical protein